MALSRLSCPECGTVLRPAKPVAVGKKVKCPRCELIFVAGEDEELDEEPRKKSSKPAKPEKKAAPTAKTKAPPKESDEESETYGYIRDPDEDNEEKKPKINYAPDESVRDLRGPAIVKLTPPANKLQLVGMIGTLGWLVLFVFLLIPTVFPIKPDETKPTAVMMVGAGLSAVNPSGGGFGFGFPGGGGGGSGGGQDKKFEEERPGFFEFFGMDLAVWFLIFMVPLMLLMVYSAMVVAGGIKMQNLESRAFSIVGSVMAMLPLHTGGVQVMTALVSGYVFGELLEDRDFAAYISLALMTIEYLISLGVGIWCLVVLMDKTVIEGFEFDPE